MDARPWRSLRGENKETTTRSTKSFGCVTLDIDSASGSAILVPVAMYSVRPWLFNVVGRWEQTQDERAYLTLGGLALDKELPPFPLQAVSLCFLFPSCGSGFGPMTS